jgi:hypothetical protein
MGWPEFAGIYSWKIHSPELFFYFGIANERLLKYWPMTGKAFGFARKDFLKDSLSGGLKAYLGLKRKQ